jgi:flagellum-specific peptidoglycan hydrolase FlgJ
MKMYGIPASIILAQGILESGAEKDLANRANNHLVQMPMTDRRKC